MVGADGRAATGVEMEVRRTRRDPRITTMRRATGTGRTSKLQVFGSF
jgi:hypothetical protein